MKLLHPPLEASALRKGTTNANLYCMVEIICFLTDTFDLHNNNKQLVARNEKPPRPGNYCIVSNGRSLLRFLCWHIKTRIRQFRREDNVAFLAKWELYSVQRGSIKLTEEAPLLRALSLQSGTRIASFRDAVRERDRRCFITSRPILQPELGI